MFTRYIRYILAALLLVVLQRIFVTLISVERIAPDVLLIFVVFIAIREGQITGTVTGFLLGFVMDMLSGELLGLAALSKTVGGFVAGYFYNKERTGETLGTYMFLFIVLLCSFVHNMVYFFVFVQGTEINFWVSLMRFGVWTSVYTCFISIIPMLFFRRSLRPG
jgi:rod shape-determining protein MreD